jgi:predicted porin
MNFKKMSLAVAIGSILAAPAAMAQSSVQIYGKLYPFFLDEKGTGATAPGTPVSSLSATPTGVSGTDHSRGFQSGNSRLGFRGAEDLGGGLKAIFQLESQLSVDDGGGSGAGGGLQFNRPTFVGFESDKFGTLRLGVLDTIFKTYGDTIGFLGVSSGTFMSTSSVLRKTGFGTSSASSFHLRKGNTVQYETPKFAGFTVGMEYQTDEAKTATRDPRLYSVGVKWDNGPFYVALAHERHYDLFGGSANAPTTQRNNAATDPANSRDTATEFVVEWRPTKVHSIEFDAVRKNYEENAAVTGRFSSYRNMAYLLSWEARWSAQWRTSAYYVTSGAGTCSRVAATCTTDGLDGRKVTIGAAYYLSKRTYLFTAASRLTNGKSARYSSNDYAGRPNPGEDLTQFALGVSHSF